MVGSSKLPEGAIMKRNVHETLTKLEVQTWFKQNMQRLLIWSYQLTWICKPQRNAEKFRTPETWKSCGNPNSAAMAGDDFPYKNHDSSEGEQWGLPRYIYIYIWSVPFWVSTVWHREFLGNWPVKFDGYGQPGVSIYMGDKNILLF